MNIKKFFCIFAFYLFLMMFMMPTNVFAADNISLNIDGAITYYDTLTEAIANVPENDKTTLTLLSDIELNASVTIPTNKKVVIDGGSTYIISRKNNSGTWYTGQLFNIKANASLILKGVIIDSGNNWEFNAEQYKIDLENNNKVADTYAYITSEENSPNVSSIMINNSGSLTIKDSVIKNHFSTSGKGLVNATAGSTTVFDNSRITHCASTGGGLVIYVAGAKAKVLVENDTFIDDNYAGSNGGIFKIYSGAVLEMNGGTVSNTRALNCNGTVSMTYGSGTTFILNDGLITGNSGIYGANNGRNAPFYVHSGSKFIMNGGVIEDNYGNATGGVDVPGHSNADIELNAGTIQHNNSPNESKSDLNVNYDYDLVLGENMNINGNIYIKGDLVNDGNINGNITLDLSSGNYTSSVTGEGNITGDVIIKYVGEEVPAIGEEVKVDGQTVTYDTDIQIVARLIFNGGIGEDGYNYDLVPVNKDGTADIVLPTRVGYTFEDWYIDEELTTKWDKSPVTSDIVLYANWTLNNYKIIWNINDEIITENYAHGSTILIPEVPEVEGYTFEDWYIDEELTTKWDKGLAEKDMNLYVNWKINQYTVTWDIDGEEFIELYNYGETIEAINNPKKDGYVFDGWDGFEKDMIVPSRDLVFLAKWKKFENPTTESKNDSFKYLIVGIITLSLGTLVINRKLSK